MLPIEGLQLDCPEAPLAADVNLTLEACQHLCREDVCMGCRQGNASGHVGMLLKSTCASNPQAYRRVSAAVTSMWLVVPATMEGSFVFGDADDKGLHVQHKATNVFITLPFPSGLDRRPAEDAGLPHYNLKTGALRNMQIWQETVWPGVERAVVKTVSMVRDQHLKWSEEAFGPPSRQFRRWQWLHFDVLVDEMGDSWVEEVNCNGFLIGNRYGYKGARYQVSGFDLAGTKGYDRSTHTARDKAFPEEFCRKQQCTAAQRNAMQDFVDAEVWLRNQGNEEMWQRVTQQKRTESSLLMNNTASDALLTQFAQEYEAQPHE